jgi:hypothetical protein
MSIDARSVDSLLLRGWSHHEGGQLLVCKACGMLYVLGGGQSRWGAKNGERLQLWSGNEEEQIPTGMSAMVTVPRPDPTKKSSIQRFHFD